MGIVKGEGLMNRIIAIIQARVGSTRLPNKVLLDLEGKTVLEHVINRVSKSKLVSETAVATTVLEEDLKIVNLCSGKGVRVYCGSEDDVLDRFYEAARLFGADHIVRVTADCPLIDYKVIDDVLSLHLNNKSEYTSNIIEETFPDGEDIEVLTFEVLKRIWQDAKLSSEREHVTPYIRKRPGIFKLSNLACGKDLSEKRWTLDEERDYNFIKIIYNALYKKNKFFGIKEILEFLKAHPEYEKINSRIGRNEGYLKSVKNDRKIPKEDRP